MADHYNRKNRRKYLLQVHLVLVTKYGKPLLVDTIREAAKDIFFKVADRYQFSIIAMETDVDHIHVLVSYDTTISVSQIVKLFKQISSHLLWKQFPTRLSKEYWTENVFLVRWILCLQYRRGLASDYYTLHRITGVRALLPPLKSNGFPRLEIFMNSFISPSFTDGAMAASLWRIMWEM